MAVRGACTRMIPKKPFRFAGLRILLPLTFVVSAVLFLPDPGTSDCVDLGRSTSYYVQGAHTVIFFEGVRPLALVEVPYCAIRRESTVRLIKRYVCDNDDILIDEDRCSIMTVSSSAGGSY